MRNLYLWYRGVSQTRHTRSKSGWDENLAFTVSCCCQSFWPSRNLFDPPPTPLPHSFVRYRSGISFLSSGESSAKASSPLAKRQATMRASVSGRPIFWSSLYIPRTAYDPTPTAPALLRISQLVLQHWQGIAARRIDIPDSPAAGLNTSPPIPFPIPFNKPTPPSFFAPLIGCVTKPVRPSYIP